jgi:hypothetical protein
MPELPAARRGMSTDTMNIRARIFPDTAKRPVLWQRPQHRPFAS